MKQNETAEDGGHVQNRLVFPRPTGGLRTRDSKPHM